MTKKNAIDYNTDDLISPWEENDIIEAEEVKKLQSKHIKREEESKKKDKKIEELLKTPTTEKETTKLEERAEEIKQLYALDHWMKCFNRVSYKNKVAGQAIFHSCLGQALNTHKIYSEDDSEIDWRLHFLWIQDSSSGKGKAMNFVNKVFNHKNFLKIGKSAIPFNQTSRKFKTHKLGRMNPASLINTYETTPKGKIKLDDNGMEIVNKGILESNDFIFSEEGRVLLESNATSLELQEIIMTGMEPIGSTNNIYTKQLTDYTTPCETRCTASFLITTRPFGKVKQTLIESGMIQRMIFFPRKLDFDDRKEMNKLSSFAFKISQEEKTSFSKGLEQLINELNKVVAFANKTTITFDDKNIDELLAFLYEKMMFFTLDIENCVPSEENRYILQSFVGRYKENLVKMAFHSAAMRFSPIVEKQDLQYSFDFFQKLYLAQKIWVSLSVEENKESKREDLSIRGEIEKYLKQDLNGVVDLPELTNHLSRKFNKEYYSAKYHVLKFSKGNNPLIKLVPQEGNASQLVKLSQ